MTTLVAPRLKVITDRRTVHTVRLSRHRQLHELTRSELLRRRLVSELEISHCLPLLLARHFGSTNELGSFGRRDRVTAMLPRVAFEYGAYLMRLVHELDGVVLGSPGRCPHRVAVSPNPPSECLPNPICAVTVVFSSRLTPSVRATFRTAPKKQAA